MAGSAITFAGGRPEVGSYLTLCVDLTDAAAATSYEESFGFPFPVNFCGGTVTVETTIAAAATNFVTLGVFDGSNQLAGGDTNSAADNLTYTADTPATLAAHDATHSFIAANGELQIRKTHAGTPANTCGKVRFVLIFQVM